MARNFPETIPSAYANDETLEDAYRRGWNHGHGLACHNVPTLGETYWTDRDGRVVADAETIREVHETLCFEAADNSRSYSPFEFTAHEFNSYGEGDEDNLSSEELWEAFEQGTTDAIFADLAEYDDEDYGIEPEEEED